MVDFGAAEFMMISIVRQSINFQQGGVQFYNSSLMKLISYQFDRLYVLSLSDKILYKVSSERDDQNPIFVPHLKLKDCYLCFSIIYILFKIFTKYRPRYIIHHSAFDLKLNLILRLLFICTDTKIIACYHYNPSYIRDNYKKIYSMRSSANKYVNYFYVRFRLLLHLIKAAITYPLSALCVDRIILLSNSYFNELKVYIPFLKSQNVCVIPNFFEFAEETFNQRNEKKKQILFVGRINDVQKNIKKLTVIWTEFCKFRSDWELHIVGDGPDKEALIKSFGDVVNETVFFHDAQNPQNFYIKSKLFLMISNYEGFGRTLIEAQHYGCVPVAFDSFSALNKIINHNQDAVIVRKNDIDAFVDSMIYLCENHEVLMSFADAAKENSHRFEVSKVKEIWIKALSF